MEIFKKKYKSWGRANNDSYLFGFPKTHIDLESLIDNSDTFLASGKRRSYGDVCFNSRGVTIDMTNFDKVLSFDKDKGIIKVQAGITIDRLLRIIVPDGWFIQTSPGTKFVSIGGAIANDIHGKNHHNVGTFGNCVEGIKIINSKKEVLDLDPEDDLFKATIGGLGLTGVILEATIQLAKIESSYLDVETLPFDNLDEFFKIEKDSVNKYEFTVSWIDLTNSNKSFCRGLFQRANWSKDRNFKVHSNKTLFLPYFLPFNIVSKRLMEIFNLIYFSIGKPKIPKSIKKTHYSSFFYPLDIIGGWNKLYGKKGFYQYQLALKETSSSKGLREILKVIKNSDVKPTLSVLKTFGPKKSKGLISFATEGSTLTMDFPKNNQVKALFAELNKIVLKNEGRINPSKDFNIDSYYFRHFYENFSEFELFKDAKIESDFWKRVS